LSDLRNNSINEGKFHLHAKTEKSVSDNTANDDHKDSISGKNQGKRGSHRVDTDETSKTANILQKKKFSDLVVDSDKNKRSKSFTKMLRKHKHHGRRRNRHDKDSEETKSKHSKSSDHSKHKKHHKHHKHKHHHTHRHKHHHKHSSKRGKYDKSSSSSSTSKTPTHSGNTKR